MQGAERDNRNRNRDEDKETQRTALVSHAGAAEIHEDSHGHDADAHGHDDHDEHEHIHIPPPSYWPIVLAACITIMFVGFVSTLILTVVGAVLTLMAIIAWGLEGSESISTALTSVPVIGGGDAEDKLTPGARVLTSDGRLVGRITRASEDSPLVKQGWVPTRYGYLARSAINHIEEGAVVLNLTEQVVRERGNVDTTPAGPTANTGITGTGRTI